MRLLHQRRCREDQLVSVELQLTGKAAAHAQTLVAELMAEGADVRPVHDAGVETDRDLASIVTDLGVGLVVEATVTVVRVAVGRWRAKHAIDSADVSFSEDATDSNVADENGDDTSDGPEPS